MIDPDRLETISTDVLISLQKKLNKELERRSGGEIKKLRTQMQKLAKSLGYELVAISPQDLGEDADKPKRRGRRPKTEETAEVES
ncbi:MAG: hypothetical protein ACREYE_00625 [Gammaproteobacteria bacterium]